MYVCSIRVPPSYSPLLLASVWSATLESLVACRGLLKKPEKLVKVMSLQ